MTIGMGPTILIVGLVLIALVWVLTRWALRSQPSWQAAITQSDSESDIPEHEYAVLLVQSGGRVEYANAEARKIFGLSEAENPNLERLARRARPANIFWELCASEGQARLAVGGKLLEGVSYRVPGRNPFILLSLRQPELNTSFSDIQDVSGSVLRIITDFGQAIAENLNLDDTLFAVIENVEKLVPSDIFEVKVWEQSSQIFISYRFGTVDGVPRLENSLDTRFGNYSTHLVEKAEPLFISDTQSYDQIRFLDETDQYSIRSYIGIPLYAGGELVGLLEVGQIAADAYSSEDQDILQLIAGQAAVAIRNALLYENEQRRAMELSGLANLAQSAGSLQDRESFFGALVNSIQPLFSIKILGFLLYDEDRRVLEGQIPFDGIPDYIVDIYRTEVPVDGPASKIVASQQIIITKDAKTDERWEQLGIQNIAQAASLTEAALVPLSSSGRFLGYLQLSDHTQGVREFTKNEQHLMNVVANQAATIIDNASLVQQTRQRARRAETMRRVASLVSSSATLDEIIRFSLRELAQLINADSASVFLIDDEEGALIESEASFYGAKEKESSELVKLYIDDAQYRHTTTASQQSFISGNLGNDNDIIDFYREVADNTTAQSAVAVPLVLRNTSVGEMILFSKKADFFTGYELRAALSVAEQLVVALETAKTSKQTDESLRARVEQLTALSRVSRELNGSLNLKHLLEIVYEEALRTTNADCGTVTIFDPKTLEEDAPTSILALGCALGMPLTEAEASVLKSGTTLLIKDIDEGEYPASHEGVRSALIAPIAHQKKTVGLLHVHAKEADHFDDASLDIVQTLAVQAAIAMGNAYSYEEQVQYGDLLERRAGTLSSLLDTTTMLEKEQPIADALQVIAQGINAATPFEVVLISVFEPSTGMMRRVTGTGLSDENLAALQEREQPFLSVQQILKPEFKLGSAYYVPEDKAPIIPSDLHILNLDQSIGGRQQGAWHAEDLFVFLLEDQDNTPLGMLSLDRPSDNLAPDLVTVETIEIFAAQAALIISSNTRLAEYKERVSALSSGLERQQRLLQISQNDLPIMLHKDLEQTITIQNLDRVALRISAGLRITEAVSRQIDASSALQSLGREILTHMGMMTAFVAEDTPEGPQLMQTMGNIPGTVNPDALFGQRNPLRACLETGELILIMNLDENDEWRESPLLTSLKTKSLVALPIKVEGETVAAVLAVSREPLGALSDEDEQVYYQIARQTSVIFQNIHLLTSVRRRLNEVNLLLDFSRTLGDLEPTGIMDALLKSALKVITTAHAGVGLFWNEFTERLEPRAVENYANNASMEKISYRYGEALPGIVFSEREPRNVDEINFTRDYTLSASQLLLYRQATGGRLPVSSLLVPILTGDYCLGVLVLDNFNKTGAFQKEDEALLLSLAQQVALALQNLRLIQATEERATQLEALTEVTATISSSLQSEELIPSVLSQLESVIPYDQSRLWLYDGKNFDVAAARSVHDPEYRGTKFAEEGELLEEIFSSGKAISVPDVRDDERIQRSGDSDYFSWLGIPLLSAGEVIGVMTLDKEIPGFYTLTHIQVGTTFAGQAAVALENARLFEDSQERATELNQLTETLEHRVVERTAELEKEQKNTKTLLDILTEVSSSLDLDLALKQTLALLNETVGAEQGTVMLVNPEDNLLHYRAGDGYLSDVKVDDAEKPSYTLKIGEGLAGWVVQHRDAILVDDLDKDERWVPSKSDLQRHRSAVAAPLMVGEDVIGVLLVFNRKVNFFSREQLQLINVIAGQVAVAINNANLYKLIREQAERLGSMLRNEQEEATRSQAILEAVADGVLVTDSENRISFLNASAENILGIDTAKITTQTLKDFSGLFGKAANIWHEIIREWSENTAAYQEGVTYAEQLELEDGRIVLVHLAPVMLRDKDFLGTVSIFRDITHEVEVDRLKSEFVATVSHELRTPMTSIRGYVDILLMGAAGALSENQTHFLEIIRSNTDRLNILVTDLLDISRLESGRITLTPQAISLTEITEDVIASIKLYSEEQKKPMEFFFEANPELPPVYADPDRIRQIVNNLVENAYHYTPENGKVTVDIHVVNGNEEVQVDVHDTGVGVAKEDQEQVFERFYRGEDPLVLATPGTGLGLPIVKQLIDMHKGSIWLESPGKNGEGSTFSFTLPVYKVPK